VPARAGKGLLEKEEEEEREREKERERERERGGGERSLIRVLTTPNKVINVTV
jgi:hypothetical protein